MGREHSEKSHPTPSVYMSSLSKLPSTIFTGGKFKELLSMNTRTLEKIPFSIKALGEELTELNLFNNYGIRQLPAAVGNLHKLHAINLEGCINLETLPL